MFQVEDLIITTLLDKSNSLTYKVKKIAATIGIAAILVLTAIFIGCPFYFATHIICPGCGMTRAFTSLFRLDIAKAFAYHPLFPLVIIAAVILITAVIRYMKSEHKNFYSFSMRDLEIVLSQIMSHTSSKIFLIAFIALFILTYIGRLLQLIPYIPIH